MARLRPAIEVKPGTADPDCVTLCPVSDRRFQAAISGTLAQAPSTRLVVPDSVLTEWGGESRQRLGDRLREVCGAQARAVGVDLRHSAVPALAGKRLIQEATASDVLISGVWGPTTELDALLAERPVRTALSYADVVTPDVVDDRVWNERLRRALRTTRTLRDREQDHVDTFHAMLAELDEGLLERYLAAGEEERAALLAEAAQLDSETGAALSFGDALTSRPPTGPLELDGAALRPAPLVAVDMGAGRGLEMFGTRSPEEAVLSIGVPGELAEAVSPDGELFAIPDERLARRLHMRVVGTVDGCGEWAGTSFAEAAAAMGMTRPRQVTVTGADELYYDQQAAAAALRAAGLEAATDMERYDHVLATGQPLRRLPTWSPLPLSLGSWGADRVDRIFRTPAM